MSECQPKRVKLRYYLTVLSGFVESLFFTGPIFGWASLVFVLKIDGYFAGYCTNGTREDSAVHTDCIGLDEHFSRVMTVAYIANTIMRFPIGYVFDRYGNRATRLIAISLYTTGTLLITLSNAETSALLYPATSCLITAGSALQTTNTQVGNLFDSYRSTIINIYSGAFDASAVVFLIIKLLHEKGVSLYASFLFLTLCSILHLLRTFFLMPRGHIPYPLPEAYTYGIRCSGRRRGRGEEEENDKEDEIKEVDVKRNKKDKTAEAETSSLHLLEKPVLEPKQEEAASVAQNALLSQRCGSTFSISQVILGNDNSSGSRLQAEASFQSCVKSWLFLWHLIWLVTILLCHLIFLSNVNPMLIRLANNDQTLVSHYTNAFAFTQLCGLLCAPINGLIMDRHKHRPLAQGETKQEADLRSSPLSLFLTSLQCFLFCVCFTCPVLPLQYLTFILQVVNSSFFYGGHQSFVSIAFPLSHYGKISGVAMSLSALALFVQFPIQHVIQHQLLGDPLYVNVCVTLVSLLAFIHPLHVILYCKKRAQRRKTDVNGQVWENY